MANICKKCSKSITDKQPGLDCGFCANVFHGRCLGIPKEQILLFTDIQGSVYKCEECRNATNIIPNTVASSLVQTLNDLKDAVKLLQDEVKLLKEKKEDDIIDTIMNEMAERRNKQKNIIIYKLEANPSDRNTSEADLKRVKDILATITPDLDTSDIKVYRLGKSYGRNIAPVKVVLHSRDDVFKILSVKKSLKKPQLQYTDIT